MKKVLLVLLVLFLGGCSANYESTIMIDGTVQEKVNFKIKKEEVTDCVNFDCNNAKIKSILKNNYNKLLSRSYKTDYKEINKDEIEVDVYSSYRSLYDYANNNPFITYFYDGIIYKEKNGEVLLKSNLYKNIILSSENKASVKIKLPYQVIDTNLEKDNNYLNKIISEEDEIYLKYKKVLTVSPLTAIKEFTSQNIYAVIIFSSLIVILGIIIVITYFRYKKHTKN